ncbi:MAG: zinc ribbon domain-containing protein [Dissulfurispiraceae bacterium]|jgi:putative FmdB family regulatory protein|nr:zinc ribbon domain-containing protein [Dissulfurispiraceae bacterium]
MPAYEYECKECKKVFMVFFSLKEFDSNPRIKCPHCESDNTVRRISGFFAKTSKKS